jgi:hypothetical protein
MVSLDLSFLSLCETNATPPSTWCSSSGISEHDISAKDDNGYFRYLALWAFKKKPTAFYPHPRHFTHPSNRHPNSTGHCSPHESSLFVVHPLVVKPGQDGP